METEIEVKFLDINIESLRSILSSLNAQLVHKERLMKRRVYDYPDERLAKVSGWIRVRDEGDQVTMSYKQLNDRTVHGTKEVNVVVDSFENTCKFFDAIGMKQKSYQETKREKWILDDVEITIDTWPWIPTFVELEGRSEDRLKDTAKKLGFDWKNAAFGSVDVIIPRYYDLTEDEINAWPEILFSPVPEWLQVRKK